MLILPATGIAALPDGWVLRRPGRRWSHAYQITPDEIVILVPAPMSRRPATGSVAADTSGTCTWSRLRACATSQRRALRRPHLFPLAGNARGTVSSCRRLSKQDSSVPRVLPIRSDTADVNFRTTSVERMAALSGDQYRPPPLPPPPPVLQPLITSTTSSSALLAAFAA